MAAFQANTGFGDDEDQNDPSKVTAYSGGPLGGASEPSGFGDSGAPANTTGAGTYGDPAAPPAIQPAAAAGGSGASTYAQGSWDMGEQGAAGAWTNGYNPTFNYASATPTQAQTPAASAPLGGVATGNPDNNPRGQNNGFGDARDNVNEFQSVFYNPTTNSYYNDFDNAALRSDVPGGRQVSLAEAGITPGSVGDPDSGWQGMKKRDNATGASAYAVDEDPYATAMVGYR